MKIEAQIENIKYSPQLQKQLETFTLAEVSRGTAFRRSSFILEYGPQKSFAISHWRGPKRSRTYPYARVYDTLGFENRVTIIPFVKDEGFDGDHDFLQWDTVSLMSLLRVYVIPAYYKSATKSSKYPNKITNQQFDYQYILERLDALAQFNQSDAVHWNLNEVQQQIVIVAKRVALHYGRISRRTGVKLHSLNELKRRIKSMLDDVANYRAYSRAQAQSAQFRESQTTHESERVTGEKSLITIKNFIGGYYYWTVDEARIVDDKLLLIEKKNSKGKVLPSRNDVKDAFVRMVLFANLSNVTVEGTEYNPIPVVGLTSDRLRGYCHSQMDESEIGRFFRRNKFNGRQRQAAEQYFQEARVNRFVVVIGSSKIHAEQILFPVQ